MRIWQIILSKNLVLSPRLTNLRNLRSIQVFSIYRYKNFRLEIARYSYKMRPGSKSEMNDFQGLREQVGALVGRVNSDFLGEMIMANSTVMKKLLMATAGAAMVVLGATGKAEALALNGTSLKRPLSLGLTSLSFARPTSVAPLAAQSARAQGMQSALALGSWYEFSFGQVGQQARGCAPADPSAGACTPSSEGNSVFAGSPPWEFEVSNLGAILKVTDAFLSGDAFNIFNFDTLIGTTSTPSQGGNCGSNPDACFADPLVSKGAFDLAPGQYSLRIVPTASPFGNGAAYFRVDEVKEVPEPVSALGLLAFGLAAANKSKRKPRSR